ncbi:immunoglobulin lambda-1 light chain, partial [Callorhinchus milii]|uniref:immunoglobulin lambda-1 light chain n=1 Tax=Callorhinchus milii TaxID=7868 RepID=UPI0004574DA9
ISNIYLYVMYTQMDGQKLAGCQDWVLQEPAVLRVLKGQSAEVTCSYKGVEAEMIAVSWKRNAWNSPVCRILYVNHTQILSPACDSRVKVAWNTSANFIRVSTRDVQVEDTDFYYCKIEFLIPQPVRQIYGNSTYLSAEASPDVRVEFHPSGMNHCCIQLVCLAENFYPDNIVLSWSKEGSIIPEWENLEILNTSNQTFSQASYLKLSDWQEGDVFSCHVNHSSLQSPLIRDIIIPFNEQNKGIRIYMWATVTCLILILVIVVGYVLFRRSRKDPQTEPVYVNFVPESTTKDSKLDLIYSFLRTP